MALASQTGENETLPSGNGSVKNQLEKYASPVVQDDLKENVFLFAPNLIGKQLSPFGSYPSIHSRPNSPRRLFANCSHSGFSLLHATSPADLLPPLQCIMLVGCAGWICRTLFQSVDHFWCNT